jgi:hypothetical protein
VNWWPGDGNANDLIGGAHGALQNGATFAAGKVGQAFSLNGVNQSVEVPPMNIGRTFSIDFWVLPDRMAGYQHLASNHFSSMNFGALYLNVTHLEYWQNSSLVASTPAGSIPLNTWSHVALTYDNMVVRLYVNGILGGESSGFHVEVFNNGMRFGSSIPHSDNYFSGLLDEMGLFNRALSPSEIQATVAADSAGKCKNAPFINAPSTLPEGIGSGGSYSQAFTATLGNPPYMFTLASGVLPSGMGLTSGGMLNGSPFGTGTFPFGVRVTDSIGASSQRSYSLNVSQCAPPPANLAGWWPGDGHANDLVGGNNGVLQSGMTFAAAGKVGQAFNFNGTQYVEVAPVNLGGTFSLSFWLFPTRLASFQHLVSNDSSSANFGALYLHNDHLEYWQSSVPRASTTAGSIPLNAWSHIALAYDGTVRLYINGNLSGASTPHAEMFNNGFRLAASNPRSDNSLEGLLDEVEVFSRALPASEVASIFNAGSGGTCKPGCPGGVNITGTVPNFCQGTSQVINLGLTGSNLDGAAVVWALDGANLGAGAVLTTTLSGLSAGQHSIVATVSHNSCPPVTASTGFTVTTSPVISNPPLSATRCAGNSVTFSVTASGTPPLGYQWRKNGSNINGATGSTFTIDPVAAGDAGSYDVLVSNACGSVPSAPATLSVTTPPAVTAASNGPICPGQTLQLTASLVAGATYSWTGPNGFSSSLQNPSIPNAAASAAGIYNVVVTSNGCTSSAQVTVAVNPPPTVSIIGAPAAPVCAGTPVNLTASITNGTAPFTFNWTKNGSPFATTASISDAPSATSNYSVTVSDSKSCTSSMGSATVMVNPVPSATILGAPAGSLCQGSRVNLSASYAPAGGAVTFSWSKNGTPLSALESISDVPSLGTTVYALTVMRNGCLSSSAQLSVNVYDYALSLTPATQTVVRGATATYLVSAQLAAGSAGAPSSVALSLSGVPSDAKVTGFPASLPLTPAGSSASFGIQTGPDSYGIVGISVTGNAGCAKSANASLNILAFVLDGYVGGPDSDPLPGNKLEAVFSPYNKGNCANLRPDQLPAQKLMSTNPGTQRLVLKATRLDPAAASVTFNIKMPQATDSAGLPVMPGFLLKGSMPVHVYDASPENSGKNLNSTVTDYQLTLCSDTSGFNCQGTPGVFPSEPGNLQPLSGNVTRAKSIRLTVPFPATNTVVVVIHLDYGLRVLASECWPAQSGNSFTQSYTFNTDVGMGGSLLPNAIATSVTAVGKK